MLFRSITTAAQALNVPVILQVGGIETNFAGGYDKIYKLANIAAAEVDIPVALHYDHGETFEELKAALEAGFTSLMIDASQQPFDKNVELTKKVVELAKPHGVTVEAELGILAGIEGNISKSIAESMQTKPKEAKEFVNATNVDALAIAIGTVHGFYNFIPEINIKRLKEIKEVIETPLVLHGGSGTPEDKIKEAISNGITKVNICTEFVAAFGKTYTALQQKEGFKYSVPNLFGPAKKAGYDLVYSKIALFKNEK